ncbi:MAG TPA: hypothetical protein VFA43_14730 [Gemmatimonadaceae bacterium]|nr:hypothetical protein [Gemmatimonadaceae bacterium]
MMISLPPKPAAQVCASLQPSVQALVKIPLKIKSAEDATTDDLHQGEAGYYSCTFAAASGYQVTVILSDEKSFKDGEQRYHPLPGFGDRGRFTDGSIHFVDVMKGKTFCEVLVGMPDDQFTEEWTHASGKICVAAFGVR